MFSFSHHAYLVRSPRESGILHVKQTLVESGVQTEGNPDVRVWNEESFSVDTARDVREAMTKKPFGDKQVCIVAGDTFTVEAQNALLKTLEEPGEGTYIVVITPNPGILLPTLLSRLAQFQEGESFVVTAEHDAVAFLSLSVPERLSYLEPMLKNKDKTTACALVDGMLEVYHNETIAIGADALRASAPYLAELSAMRGYLTDRSSSVKLIMEHLALLLPVREKKQS
ncbi:MAG: hypothetical protein HGB03_03390 [Candidatus Yonathbacteria bacterium]|nr:hypothetical protein [Candidatus Yonathbacteria bacterium]NTW47328.1 hypothetical protein [Candidatus Yonathbacteria bacterium]